MLAFCVFFGAELFVVKVRVKFAPPPFPPHPPPDVGEDVVDGVPLESCYGVFYDYFCFNFISMSVL